MPERTRELQSDHQERVARETWWPSRLLRLVLLAAVVAFATASWLLHGGLRDPAFEVDTFDYAQMARQVERGEGFTMLQTFPYVQRYLVARGMDGGPPWPNTTRFPLIAVFEATAFRVLGAGDVAILATGGALFVATAALVFLLGSRLFGPLAGLVAALALALDPVQLRFSRSGLLETGAGLLLVAAALALARTQAESQEREAGRRWALILGALLGLAFLQRYDLLVALPVALVLVWKRGPGLVGVVSCCAGFLAAAGPWLARNLVTIGTLLGSTSVDRNLLGGLVDGDVYMDAAPVNPWLVALEHWPALLGKFETAAAWTAAHAGELLGGLLPTACGVLLVLLPLVVRTREARVVWGFLVGVFVARALLLAVMHNEARFYLSYTPLVYVLAAGMAAGLLPRLVPRPVPRPVPGETGPSDGGVDLPAAADAPVMAGVARPAWTVATCGVVLAVAALLLPSGPWTVQVEPPPPMFPYLARVATPGTVVASDVSWHVAWYSDLPSIRFSGRWSELAGMEEAGVRVGAVAMHGPSGLAFEAAHDEAGGGHFERGPDFRNGYRTWLRLPYSESLAPRE